MTRTPSKPVQKILSREVGFVCPVDGCESPYLTWHHFDPPWSIREHHDPNGMIALCFQHHKEADHGAFSKEQLRLLKSDSKKIPKGQFHWKREQVLLFAGGIICSEVEIPLMILGRPIIWFTTDDRGYQMLNFDLLNSSGEEVVSMRDNCWTTNCEIIEMCCPPAAKQLSFKYRSGLDSQSVNISFEELDPNKPVPGLSEENSKDIQRMRSSSPVVACNLNCHILYPAKIIFDRQETKFGFVTMKNFYIRGSQVGIQI